MKIYFFGGIFFLVNILFGQQLPFLRSQFYAPQHFNPSSFGTWNDWSANVSSQFTFAGGNTFTTSGNFVGDIYIPMKQSNFGIGTGLIYLYDHVGFSESHSFGIPINFQSRWGEVNWSVGATSRITRSVIVPDWVPPSNVPDPNLPDSGAQTKFMVDGGFMIYTQRWYLGFAVAQFNAPLFDKINFQAAAHLFFHGGYRFQVADKVQLFPSLMLGFDGAIFQYQAAFLAQFLKPGISFGAGFGRTRLLSGILSYDIKNFNVIWQTSYTFLGNPLNRFVAHELRLSYRLQKPFGCSSCQKRNGRYECEHDKFL